MDKQMMFNNPFKLPTYSEWKESVEKINADVSSEKYAEFR
jgi:hypothetical protein